MDCVIKGRIYKCERRFLLFPLILLLALGMFAMTGCGESEESKEETLVVGLDDTFAPMGFRDEAGDLVGFDIDLANKVGEVLGMSVEFKPIDWNAKEMELKSGTIGLCMERDVHYADRLENMSLSDKYLNNKIVLMTLADSDLDVTEAEQLSELNKG